MKKLNFTLVHEGYIDLEDDCEYTEGQILSLVKDYYYSGKVNFECNYTIEEE